jgi:two-component system, NarL family, sensor kinase
MASGLTLADLAANPELRAVLVQHARRGLRIQLVLRGILVLFCAGTVAFVPPTRDAGWCWLVVGCYAAGALAVGAWSRHLGPAPLRLAWVTLFGDLAALIVLSLLAGRSAVSAWTVDVLVNGFFLVPLLAATQLRPLICAAVVVPTDLAYLGAGLATRAANAEPLASVLLRTAALAGLSIGCVALSRVQRSRVLTIGSLVQDRMHLLADLVDLEDRERRRLSEQLHDGALQYILGARMDLDDLRGGADPAAVERIDHALTRSAALLRVTVGELYPAVLERAGLPEALRQAAASAAARAGITVSVEDSGWPAGARTSSDAVVYAAARELVTNVVKHADASTVRVAVGLTDGAIRLTVADDGSGIPDGELDRKLRAGHIGLASHRARIAAAGGELSVAPGPDGGTVATVTAPATPRPPGDAVSPPAGPVR